jgi:hypothetical protein
VSILVPGDYGSTDLTPDHGDYRIITFIRHHFQMADRVIGARSDRWNDVEDRYRAYIDLSSRNEQSGKLTYPWEETIVVPYSYALVQAIAAYLYTIFMAQVPLQQLQPASGDYVKAADRMELLLDHYARQMGASLLLYGWILDAVKYGIGITKTVWQTEINRIPQAVRRPVSLMGVSLGTTTQTVMREMTTYDGPKSWCTDPWMFYPDPRMPVARFQEGTFCGELQWVSWVYLKSLEKSDENPDGVYENVDDIPRWGYSQALSVYRQSRRLMAMGLPDLFQEPTYLQDRGFVLLEELWAKVIPSDLGLGPGKRPELWVFTCANRSKVIRKERVRDSHGKFPYSVWEYSPDMHSTQNPGMMEVVMPLQDFMDWLFNSHMENTRKALNNEFVVDPQRVYYDDIINPAPFRVIRLRPEYMGTNIQDAIFQLPVQDVTRNHLQDVQMMFDLMQRVSAALDALMGVPSARRKTASEATGTFQLAANRLKVLVQLMSTEGFVPWTKLQVALIQQWMTDPQMVKIVGPRQSADTQNLPDGSLIEVQPEDILGEFFFPIHDGSMPLDPVRTAETWQQIMTGMSKIPPLMAQYDIGKVFERAVRTVGVRNIEEFKIKAQVMPDGQVQQNVQRGNLVPAGPGGPAAGGPAGPGGMGGAAALGPFAGLASAGGGPPPSPNGAGGPPQ